MPDYSKELQIAQKAAIEASQIIKEYASGGRIDIGLKGKNDLVTEADLSSERRIIEMLNEAFPGDRVVAEETASGQWDPDQRTWLIDPLDGTTNFAHGFPVFCVSIALWEKGKPKVGVVLEVNRGELFHAVTEKGAFLNNNPIRVSGATELSDALVATGFPYRDWSMLENYLAFFEWMIRHSRGIRRAGAAAYDLCCVGAGRFDGFYEYALNPWDVGAGALVISEAGGRVSDWKGEGGWLLGKRIVAGTPPIHRQLLEAIGKHFTEEELVYGSER